jgi:hypothetical protein
VAEQAVAEQVMDPAEVLDLLVLRHLYNSLVQMDKIIRTMVVVVVAVVAVEESVETMVLLETTEVVREPMAGALRVKVWQ